MNGVGSFWEMRLSHTALPSHLYSDSCLCLWAYLYGNYMPIRTVEGHSGGHCVNALTLNLFDTAVTIPAFPLHS